MKILYYVPFFLLMCSYSLLESAPASYADNDKLLYLQLSGGLMIPNDSDEKSVSLADPNLILIQKNRWDGTYNAAIAAGIYVPHDFRFELEYSYRRVDYDYYNSTKNDNGVITYNHESIAGGLSIHSIMLNVYYDMHLTDKCYLYMGGGLGNSWVLLSGNNSDGAEIALGYQVMSGIGYRINDRISVLLGYRFFTTAKLHYDAADRTEDFETPIIHIFEAGIRYDF